MLVKKREKVDCEDHEIEHGEWKSVRLESADRAVIISSNWVRRIRIWWQFYKKARHKNGDPLCHRVGEDWISVTSQEEEWIYAQQIASRKPWPRVTDIYKTISQFGGWLFISEIDVAVCWQTKRTVSQQLILLLLIRNAIAEEVTQQRSSARFSQGQFSKVSSVS